MLITMVKIAPKSKSKADFCGVGKYYYIIRTDLTCYMRSTNFNLGENLEIFSLHPSCRKGDHYLAHESDHFYIIQSNNYRCVSNMSTDEGASVHTLHPKWQGGDHYFSVSGAFYITFQGRGVYRRAKNMHTDEGGEQFSLNPESKNGLYYFGRKNAYYVVKPDDKLGVQYTRSTNLNTKENVETFSFHKSVYNFLPGGLAFVKGPAFGEWVNIKTISNDAPTTLEWKKQVNKKIGYEKGSMSSMERSWKVSSTVPIMTGGLSASIVKVQFSLTAEFGGISSNTEKENWSEVTKVEEELTVILKPQQKKYIYVYQLGLGEDPVLHSREMRILDSPTPPTDNPLPPAV